MQYYKSVEQLHENYDSDITMYLYDKPLPFNTINKWKQRFIWFNEHLVQWQWTFSSMVELKFNNENWTCDMYLNICVCDEFELPEMTKNEVLDFSDPTCLS